MARIKSSAALSSELMAFLASKGQEQGARLPPIDELARELRFSSGKVREQLEVARVLGLVDVRPKTGIRVLPYSFGPAARASMRFALAVSPRHFESIGVLRNHLEAAFWHEAVRRLEPGDILRLRSLVEQAWAKLRSDRVQIPHIEHRDLHMAIYSRLENIFVLGLLEAYWDAYEAVGLDVYSDYRDLEQVWTYHDDMVSAIEAGDYEGGYRTLVEHTGLLNHRSETRQSAGSVPGVGRRSNGQVPMTGED